MWVYFFVGIIRDSLDEARWRREVKQNDERERLRREEEQNGGGLEENERRGETSPLLYYPEWLSSPQLLQPVSIWN